MERLIIHIHENADPVWILWGKCDAQKLYDNLVKNGKLVNKSGRTEPRNIRALHPCYQSGTGFVKEMIAHLENIKNSNEKDTWDGLPFTIK